jgi:PAS domain S-box-containing protein
MAHPLLCWDIVQEGLYRRKAFENDLKQLQQIAIKNKWHYLPVAAENCLIWENKVAVITNTRLQIEYTTSNMCNMNGYTLTEIKGKTPAIFQGPATEQREKARIRLAINTGNSFITLLTNYRKDGSLYKCRIEGYPVYNYQHQLVNFIAFENIA